MTQAAQTLAIHLKKSIFRIKHTKYHVKATSKYAIMAETSSGEAPPLWLNIFEQALNKTKGSFSLHHHTRLLSPVNAHTNTISKQPAISESTAIYSLSLSQLQPKSIMLISYPGSLSDPNLSMQPAYPVKNNHEYNTGKQHCVLRSACDPPEVYQRYKVTALSNSYGLVTADRPGAVLKQTEQHSSQISASDPGLAHYTHTQPLPASMLPLHVQSW